MPSYQARVIRIETHREAEELWWAQDAISELVHEATEEIRNNAEAGTSNPYFARNMVTLYEEAGQARSKRPVGFVRSSGWHSQEYEATHGSLARAVKPQ